MPFESCTAITGYTEINLLFCNVDNSRCCTFSASSLSTLMEAMISASGEAPRTKITECSSSDRTRSCLQLRLWPSITPDQTLTGSITFPGPGPRRVLKFQYSIYPHSQRRARWSSSDEKLACTGIRDTHALVTTDRSGSRESWYEDSGGGTFCVRNGVRRMLAGRLFRWVTELEGKGKSYSHRIQRSNLNQQAVAYVMQMSPKHNFWL